MSEPGIGRTSEVVRTVTVLFADLAESSRLTRQGNPDDFAAIVRRFFQEAKEVIERYGGKIESYQGDGFLASFGLVGAHFDAAVRAVTAGYEFRAAIQRLNREEFESHWEVGGQPVRLSLHIGINTGEADISEEGVYGDAVHIANRLMEAAGSDEILVGPTTYQLVRNVARLESVGGLILKPHDRPLTAWRLLAVELDRVRSPARTGAPMVGRELETALLRLAYERVVDGRDCHLVLVLGLTGVGKSRLVDEFVRALGEQPRVLYGRCLPFGDAIGYRPIAQVIRQAAGIRRGDAPSTARQKLADLVGGDEGITNRLATLLDLPGTVGEAKEAYRALCRLLELVASDRPLVLVIDDLHCAQQVLLDFLEDAAESLDGVPVLLLGMARSEFFAGRRNWSANARNALTLDLPPLRRGPAGELACHLLRARQGIEARELSDELLDLVWRTTAGNPFFIEEASALLAEEGAVRAEGDRLTVVGDPATLAKLRALPGAVVGPRLDRLSQHEQLAITRAAVVGMRFTPQDVAALLEDSAAGVLPVLEGLTRRDLVHHDATSGLPASESPEEEQGYIFRHTLVQETAYRRIAKSERAELHEGYANWLEHRADQSPQVRERIGFHFEQAYRYRQGRVPQGEAALDIARRGGEHLAAAGGDVLRHGAFPETAIDPLQRALALLPDDHPARLQAMLDLADAMRDSVKVGIDDTMAAYQVVIDAAKATGDRLIEQHAVLGGLEARWFQGFKADLAEDRELVEQAQQEFERAGDALGLAEAWRLLGYLCWVEGRLGVAQDFVDRALRLAQQQADERLEGKLRRLEEAILFWGATPLHKVIGRTEESLGWARGKGMFGVQAASLSILARAVAMQGDFEQARARNHEAAKVASDQAEWLTQAVAPISQGLVEILDNNLDRAEEILTAGYTDLERLGGNLPLTTIAALLARVHLWQQERDEDAERRIAECARLAGGAQLNAQITVSSLRAVLRARRGELARAEELAREALLLAGASEQPESRAEALFDAAEVSRLAGRNDEAAHQARLALRCYEDKGNDVMAARVKDFLRRIGP